VIRRPRYRCRGCESTVVQAPAPERPLTGGMASEALLAQVLVAKYSDHLPLYRQAQIFARHGIDLDRSTPANCVGRACWWLRPLAELLLGSILSSPKIFADDTPVPVLDPGRGRTKTGRLWSYARDDQRPDNTFNEQRRSDGHEFDTGTGLLYEDARYLGPTLGRFLSEDPNFIAATH
jgi:RHS repeat-associated protein